MVLIGCTSASKSITSLTTADSSVVSPQLFIQPAYIFDVMCQRSTGFKIDPAIQNELMQKAVNFQSEWDQRASRLISLSEEIAGRKFIRKEYSVALTLCKWIPMGDPAFIVSAGPYLGLPRLDRNTKLPLNMSVFVSMTHHELLHSLVDNIINQDFSNGSAMLEKYKSEPFNVIVHLHLMALQKSVNEKLADTDLIQATDQMYSYIGGDYKRVWEIIQAEGTKAFTDELQAYNSKK